MATVSTNRRTIQGERRVVTILFSDVKNSTQMAEKLDPEEWAEIMNEAFRHLTAPIQRYGGTIARLMGDGILAFFGAPEAHEDDPQRAVLAGLAILKGIQPFCEEIRNEYGLEFNIRVGINTGAVVVGDIGTEAAFEYTAMGDAVNIAARMEETAEPGSVQIAEDTQKAVAPLFELEAIGGVAVKGKDQPVPAYRVVQAKEAPGSLRGIKGLSSPLVGRDQETESLKEALEGLRNGQSAILNIIGDAGLGKSRLIQEAARVWTDEFGEEAWDQTQGISYDSNQPYSLFIDFIRSFFDIEPTDSTELIREKVNRCLSDWPAEKMELLSQSIELLLVIGEGDQGPVQEAEALQREFTDAVRTAWRETATRSPFVLVFDDLHWADPTSINILTQLFSLTDEVPILFLCAMRPYRSSPGWGVKIAGETEFPHRYHEIDLQPLTDQHSDELIGNLLTVSELPEELHDLILRKAEGNPFFVEEVIRTLIEEAAIVRDETGLHWQVGMQVEDISLPDNLQALLIARIDRLEGDIRRTLQLASVIGRSFFYRILEAVDEATVELTKHLSQLQRVELIEEAARMPELEYMFRHEITRDAAYETILRRERRKYHRSVGEAIEALFPERIDDEAPRLAVHFAEAWDYEKAFEYYIKAGDHARRLYANTEAIQAYSKALELVDRVDVDLERLIYLYKRRRRTYELINLYDEALENYRELGEVGEKRGEKSLQLAALLSATTIHSTPTVKVDPDKGRALGDQALQLARQLNDPQGESEALWNLMLLEGMINGNRREAIEYGELSLQIAREHDLREQLAFTLHDLSRQYLVQGGTEQAMASAVEARELWQELDNQTMLGNNYIITANILQALGEIDQAIDLAKKGLQISQSIGSNWGQGFSLSNLAELYLELGDFDAALEAINQALLKGRQAQFAPLFLGYEQALLSWIYALLGAYEKGFQTAIISLEHLPLAGKTILANLHYSTGDRKEAEKLIDDLLDQFDEVRKYPIPTASSFVLAIIGEAAIGLGKKATIKELVAEASGTIHEVNTRTFLADMKFLESLIYFEEENYVDASEALRNADEIAQQIGSRRAQLNILPKLIEVETLLGHTDLAEEARLRSNDLIDFISNHIGSDELQESFLATRTVQAVKSLQA